MWITLWKSCGKITLFPLDLSTGKLLFTGEHGRRKYYGIMGDKVENSDRDLVACFLQLERSCKCAPVFFLLYFPFPTDHTAGYLHFRSSRFSPGSVTDAPTANASGCISPFPLLWFLVVPLLPHTRGIGDRSHGKQHCYNSFQCIVTVF